MSCAVMSDEHNLDSLESSYRKDFLGISFNSAHCVLRLFAVTPCAFLLHLIPEDPEILSQPAHEIVM